MNLQRESLSLLRYYRNTLSDYDRRSLKSTTGDALTLEDIESGVLSATLRLELFKKWQKHVSERKAKGHQLTGEETSISVVFGLLTLRVKSTAAKKNAREDLAVKTVLWVPALLDANGMLRPYRDRIPWISRGALKPSADPGIEVASVEDYDAFLRAHPEELLNWKQLIEYTHALVRDVLRQPLSGFELVDHNVEPPFVQIYPDEAISAQHIITLYDNIQADAGNEARGTALWGFFAEPVAKPLGDVNHRLHLGQMEAHHGLSKRQREALQAFVAGQDGEIQAVTGPPGTGKTTLLQSVVATSVVDAALAQGPPRLLLACSTNNQAITNIQDSFAKVQLPDDHFLAKDLIARRWLPDVTSYCLYLPARDRQVDKKRPSYARNTGRSWEGLVARMEDRDYVREAEAYFISQYRNRRAGSATTVEQIVAELHKELTKARGWFEGLLAAHDRLTAAYQVVGGDEALRQRNDAVAALDSQIASLHQQIEAKSVQVTKGERSIRGRAKVGGEMRAAYKARSVVEMLLDYLPEALLHAAPLKEAFKRRAGRVLDIARARNVPVDQLKGKSALPRHLLAFIAAFEAQGAVDEKRVNGHREECAGLKRALAEATRAKATVLQNYQALETAEDTWRKESAEFYRAVNPGKASNPRAYDDLNLMFSDLDTKWRYYMFQVAARYWEGRWLLEMSRLFAGNDDRGLNGKDKAETIARYRRFSMVTPLLVSTFHMAPRYFTYFSDGKAKPLTGFADYLIVDEAGQVSPEIAAPTFALAKRAFVVGDTDQIEPIWNTMCAIDEAMLKEVALYPQADNLMQAGYRTFGGNLMAMAKHVTARTQAGTRGVLLTEHRRCYDSIIAACNDLVYNGQLVPLRGEPRPGAPLPTLGYAYVQGQAQPVGGSLRNAREATQLANWLSGRKDAIEQAYQKMGRADADLASLIAIITPYKAQVAEINRQLMKVGLKDIEVGTVHSFQGAERPIVIFSPVYTPAQAPYPFVNRRPNFLNVAISRAQDSFIFFGDIAILEGSGNLGILGKHLFLHPNASITDHGIITSFDAASDGVLTLETLREHQDLLASVLKNANERILIQSSYIPPTAASGENVVKRLQEVVRRGVRVTVVVDARSVRSDKDLAGYEALKAANVDVRVVRGIYRNVLSYDKAALCEGTVNWFGVSNSVAATLGDVSYLYYGANAMPYIEAVWHDLANQRALARTA